MRRLTTSLRRTGNTARELLETLRQRAREAGVPTPSEVTTPYHNTIPKHDEVPYPGDRQLERRIEALIRWNAMAMVHGQNKKDAGIGGHISTYSSLATLLEVGLQSLLPRSERMGEQPGDFVYFQGHASPGVYARAFLEGRFDEERLKNFRHELRGEPGLSSYPHPWLMPDFWQFPYGFDGDRAAECDLSGAVYAVPRESRADSRRRIARSGRLSAMARRMRSIRWARSRWVRGRSWTT